MELLYRFDCLTFNLNMETYQNYRGEINYFRRIKFDNGYMLSIVCNTISYGSGNGLFEAALMNHEGDFIYDESLGFKDGQRGYLDFCDVAAVIEEVRQFEFKE